MRALEVFKARHRFAQEVFYDELWDYYTETELRKSVCPTMNSLAWVLWHVARIEDAGVMRFVARKPQVFHTGDWKSKLNIDVEHFGYGMSNEEMRALSDTINLTELRNYWKAVVTNTLATVDTLTPEVLDEELTDEEVAQVMVTEGVGAPIVGTDVPYSGWTRLEALFHFSVTHYYWHGGEVRTIEGLLEADRES